MTETHRRLLPAATAAFLLAGLVLTLPLAPAADAITRHSMAGTRVTIVHDAGDESAAAVAAELDGLLRDAAGFRRVRLVEATTPDAFLDAVAATRSEALVLIAHGAPEGLLVGGALVTWDDARASVAQSGARHVFLGACWSAAFGALDGKALHTAFEGLVDERLVAPQVLVDLVDALAPSLREPAKARLLEHIDARGGLDAYARLVVSPERPMNVACNDKMDRWYEGQDVSTSGECIVYLNAGNFNCHSESDRRQSPCKDYTAADQERFVREQGSASADSHYGDDSWASGSSASSPSTASTGASAFYDSMSRAFNAEVTHNNGHYHFKIGKDLRPDKCWTALRLEQFLSGGMSTLVQKSMTALRAKVFTGSAINTDGSFLALRVCGGVSMGLYGFDSNPQGEAQVKGGFHLDGRLSAFGQFEWLIPVLWWEVPVWIYFETGASVPFKGDVTAGVRACYNSNGSWSFPNFYWRFAIPFSMGKFGLFAQANVGYAGLGLRQDFGGVWNPTFEATGWCPPGTKMSPGSSSTAQADEGSPLGRVADVESIIDLPLADAYRALIEAGLAVENPAPTFVRVDEESRQAWRLVADFLELEPEDGAYMRLRETGVLDALGVPELREGEKLVLDRANARVAAALGDPVEGMPIPRVSLRGDGVLVVPKATLTTAAGQSLCSPEVNVPSAPLLQAKACAGYTAEPLPVVGASAAVGTELPGPSLVDPAPYTGAADTLLGTPHEVVCSQGVMRAACVDARNLGSLGSGQGYVDFLREIHRQFQLVQRVDLATMLNQCGNDGILVDLSQGANLPGPVVHPSGSAGVENKYVTTCVTLSWSLPTLPLKQANDQFLEGQLILADMEANSLHWGISTVGKPLESAEDVPDVVGYVWGIACPRLPGCQGEA